jgi:hypothetical protein
MPAKAKRSKREAALRLAPRPIRSSYAESPYTGRPEKVVRVIDPISKLVSQGAIDAGQRAAAEKYAAAAIAVSGNLNCALSNADVPVPVKPASRIPLPSALIASAVLSDAETALGLLDGTVVRLVCGYGFSIMEAARRIYDQPSERDVVSVGKRLRESLDVLSQRWFPARSTTTAFRTFARAPEFTTGLIDMPIRAVHASQRGVR